MHDAWLRPRTFCPCGYAVCGPVAHGRAGHRYQERGAHASCLLTTAIALVPAGGAGPPRCTVHASPATEKLTAYATLALARLRLDSFGPTTPPALPRPAALVRRPLPARAQPPPRRLVGDPPPGPQVCWRRARGRVPCLSACGISLRSLRGVPQRGSVHRSGPSLQTTF
jgi:hypothetical protein